MSWRSHDYYDLWSCRSASSYTLDIFWQDLLFLGCFACLGARCIYLWLHCQYSESDVACYFQLGIQDQTGSYRLLPGSNVGGTQWLMVRLSILTDSFGLCRMYWELQGYAYFFRPESPPVKSSLPLFAATTVATIHLCLWSHSGWTPLLHPGLYALTVTLPSTAGWAIALSPGTWHVTWKDLFLSILDALSDVYPGAFNLLLSD